MYIDGDTEKLAWRVNTKSIIENYYDIIGYDNEGSYVGNLLILQGEKSYIWDISVFQKTFPKITHENLKIIENAGMKLIKIYFSPF